MTLEAASCPVCMEGYKEDADGPSRTPSVSSQIPQVLSCGHTVCKRCLKAIGGGRSAATLLCPVCRTETSISAVKTNFGMIDIIRSMAGNQQPAAAPLQQDMGYVALASAPPAPGELQPWDVGPGDIYNAQALQTTHIHFAPPAGMTHTVDEKERQGVLRDWGRKRERKMHRAPKCLMDQMVSGSGYYPIRLLEDQWFNEPERAMVQQLEQLLQGTGHHLDLARDMLTPVMYDVDVRIILDNSGSMQNDMYGNGVGGMREFEIEAKSYENPGQLQRILDTALPLPRWSKRTVPPAPATGGLSPHHRRWYHARDLLHKWREVYRILGLDPPVYLLNPTGQNVPLSQIDRVFAQSPEGRTPMTEALQQVLWDRPGAKRPLLILVVTDGEANNMVSFSVLLDQIQNGTYGDVQVCIVGLSLVKEDIEWFEMEECDETRIRTVESFEVEQRQIQLKEVVKKEGNYNYMMHTYRVLVTNFFPAEYDYEAHLQNLRHRLYITVHGRDRWYGINSTIWSGICTNLLCPACFVATCFHCNGWCQGNDCGKYEKPAILESLCGDE